MKMEEEEERENQNLLMKIFSYLYIHCPYVHNDSVVIDVLDF